MIADVIPFPQVQAFRRGDHVELGEYLLQALRKRQGKIVYDEGALWQYDASRHAYVEVSDDDQTRVVQSAAGKPAGDKGKPLKLRWSDVHGAKLLAQATVTEKDFFKDAAPGLSFANYFVQVTPERGVEVLAHDPEHRVRFAYPFDYEPGGEPPMRWFNFLFDIFGQDEDAVDKVSLLQEYCGAALLGHATRFQRCLIFSGVGSNGKGVVSKVIEACFPPGSTCAIPPQQWGDQYRLAMIAGKRLNLVSELPEADILESEKFKAMVAGDAMTGRHIREAPFTFSPIAGHVFSANRLPQTDDHTHGFWRRMLMLSFNRKFNPEEENPMLVDELLAEEKPAIVAWFFEGAHRVLTTRRFTLPSSSAQLVDEWKAYSDQIRAFVAERCEPCEDESEGVLATTLYTQYQLWAQESGHAKMAKNKFGMRMRGLGHEPQHSRRGHRYLLRMVDQRRDLL